MRTFALFVAAAFCVVGSFAKPGLLGGIPLVGNFLGAEERANAAPAEAERQLRQPAAAEERQGYQLQCLPTGQPCVNKNGYPCCGQCGRCDCGLLGLGQCKCVDGGILCAAGNLVGNLLK